MPPDQRQAADEPAPLTEQEVRAALALLLESPHLSGSARLCALLGYVVEKTLTGEEQYLKEYVLGTDVFGRGADYDPRVDPIVRSHAGRLRKKLADYYAEHPDTPVLIDLPKGHYVPAFSRRAPEEPAEPGASLPEPPAAPAAPVNRARVAWLVALAGLIGAVGSWLLAGRVGRVDLVTKLTPAEAAAPRAAEVAAEQVAVPPEIDGRIDTAWAGRLRTRVAKRLAGGGPAAARFGALWDGAKLYLMVEVRDDEKESQPANSRAHGRDEIEVYLDTQPDRRRGYQAHTFQFLLPSRGGPPTEQNSRVAGVRMAAETEPWGYRVEAAIPWETLGVTGEAGRTLGFDLGVQRRHEPSAYLMWQGSADNWFDPSGFGRLTLSTDLVNSALATVMPLDEWDAAAADGRVLRVSDGGPGAAAVVRFALPQLASRILGAKLRLYCGAASGPGRGQIIKVSGALAGAPPTFQSAILVTSSAGWYEWDVTPVARRATEAGHPDLSLLLHYKGLEGGGGWVEFMGSRAADREPRLVLEY